MRSMQLFGPVRSAPARTRAWSRLVGALSALMISAISLATTAAERPAPGEGAPVSSAPAIPALRQATNVAVITIQGPIDAVTAFSVERRIKQAEDGGADCIVMDINTPGGEVPSVLAICSAIKRSKIQNSIGWVNPDAYSGGAYIALACREIIVSRSATMGDAAPVMGSAFGMMQMPATERAKQLAPLLAELVDSARLRGYDEKLVQAFVMLGVELWMIRDKQSGEVHFIDEAEWENLFGTEPPRGNPRMPSGAAPGAEMPTPTGGTEDEVGPAVGDAEPQTDTDFRSASPELASAVAGKVSEMLDAPSTRPEFTAADADRYEFVAYATDGQALLTLKEQDLIFFGLAQETISTDEELKQFLGATNLRRLDASWSEWFVALTTQGASGLIIRGVLIVVFLIALFLEMSMPGVGLPGIVAILALIGLFVPPMLIGASAWWALAAIVMGVCLLAVEVLILPGFGVPGVLGLGLMFVGLVGSFAGIGDLFPGVGGGGSSELTWALATVLTAIFAASIGMYFISRYTHRIPIANKLMIAPTTTRQSDESLLGAMGPSPAQGLVRVGDIGTATTTLRPSGTAMFDDRLVDVVSEFGFVDAGQRVRVASVTRYRVGVEAIRGDEPGAAPTENA